MKPYLELMRHVLDQRTEALPVMVLTSSEDPHDREVCSRLGVIAFLFKPLEDDELNSFLSTAGTTLPVPC